MKKIIAIIGARPQFIKHAPIALAMQNDFILKTLHTGQHYDANMSKIFFDELNIKKPDYQLNIGGGTHGQQTGDMLKAIEPILFNESPDAVIVYGDTNSTLAGALAAAKLNIPVIHIEAGLRSFNRKMPEEINRLLTDQISGLLFCPNQTALAQLREEGIKAAAFVTGDIMADLLKLTSSRLPKITSEFVYATIHRPYNTDDPKRLHQILVNLNKLPWKVKFAVHPRTRKIMKEHDIKEHDFNNITFVSPLGYFENIQHLKSAKALITDSGGMQKEAYLLKTPCTTLRSETEWTETLTHGWNQLLFEPIDLLNEKVIAQLNLIAESEPIHNELLYGDGQAALQIKAHISEFLD